MKSGFFSAISRLRWIQRWSLKRNTLTENVMEHSWEVAVIAHLLGAINNKVFDGSVNPDRLSTLGLYHDSAESITGDLPTPVKYYSEEIQKAYKVIEQDAEKSLVTMLPAPLRGLFNEVICGEGVSPLETNLVKAADNLSAFVKALAEIANGNREYEITVRNLKDRLYAYDLAEVNYFLEHFVEQESNTVAAANSNAANCTSPQFEADEILKSPKIRAFKLAH
ncbi:5'-deoxynucleotidase [Halioxenophilus aromaticivorans]|uniref:5'-deoxynucleotidase n=1 Tax=Halioxenophilus aromaticivorans TaxID=1306992 RepID=A0AAV3U3N0_9ALTE